MPGPTDTINAHTMGLDEVRAEKTKLSKTELIALDEKCNAQIYKSLPVVIAKGKGCYLYDNEGKEYLDFLGGYGAVSQGHLHPKIVAAAKSQLDTLTLASRAYYNDMLSVYAKFITDFFNYECFVPMNSGTEAAETSCKIARKWAYDKKGVPKYEAKIICAEENFWGRSIAAVSASTCDVTRDGFGPFLSGFIIIPFNDIPALEKVLIAEGTKVAAFMVEPVQGEAGVKVPSAGYLKAAKQLCEKYNCLLIADEIQSGLCRTGRMLCSDHEGIRPDLVVLGKALSGGIMPVSGVLGDKATMATLSHGSHGSTFGGNPLGAAVAIASLSVLRDEKLAENAEKMGKLFRAEMLKLKDEVSWIVDVRGMGLMNCVEVDPKQATAWDLCLKLLDVGILSKPTHVVSVRFTPALIITEEQIMVAVGKIRSVFLNFKTTS